MIIISTYLLPDSGYLCLIMRGVGGKMGPDIINSYVYRNGHPNGFDFPFRFFSVAILWVVGALFIASALLMWLWNITMTRIFNLREITYWEAFRLMIIAGLLFGGGLRFTVG